MSIQKKEALGVRRQALGTGKRVINFGFRIEDLKEGARYKV